MDRLQKAARARVRRVVGLNSGTSADGLDLILLEVRGDGWSSKIRSLRFRSVPFPPDLKNQIHSLLNRLTDPTKRNSVLTEDLVQTDMALGRFMGRSARTMIQWARRHSLTVHLVASHGQTVWHTPGHRPGTAATLQLGHPHSIAVAADLPVVADFRAADIAAGGQGAPLTPAFDYLLFKDCPEDTVALNLGGITNLTMVPAGGRPEEVIGFDIGPCNLLLDGLCRLLGGLPYDRGGRLSRDGRSREEVVRTLLQHPFYHKPPPRSTGREDFGPEFIRRFIRCDGPRRSLSDHLATGILLIARSVAAALREEIPDRYHPRRLVISGGGARNPALVAVLRKEGLSLGLKLVPFLEKGMTADSKEAGLFAWLGSEAVCGNRAHLPQVTGARSAQILGVYIP
ncbi:MAG: anhydro-N-acetylmuramic acid kinase [Candidatus Eisenbacteria bacterium]|uniref:Anhydro-N-acetylmuramic acid kinase n=1 Tax=Eiseniibacteriota bacterium TaxID=2212470 RepID=A0A948RWY5_UNCEI|nr:anhydro-N-acetylmuramic acid kinase [Candidatus Eisenbacteria bacterium]MBU1949522.1 anhydro-N-acetylmuramic acid kinase [Candidatus Eisenbacteria bacterium]MBU2692553.1 anhydro-N-acetylmuramic acid kinase [Candidatus Eisenbacteria bacterium]